MFCPSHKCCYKWPTLKLRHITSPWLLSFTFWCRVTSNVCEIFKYMRVCTGRELCQIEFATTSKACETNLTLACFAGESTEDRIQRELAGTMFYKLCSLFLSKTWNSVSLDKGNSWFPSCLSPLSKNKLQCKDLSYENWFYYF